MNYFTTTPHGNILNVSPNIPSENLTFSEATDEQIQKYNSLLEKRQHAVLVDGRVTSKEEESQSQKILKFDRELGKYVSETIPVPKSIRHWQAVAALKIAGIYDQVILTIEAARASTDEASIVLVSAWDGRADLSRNSSNVATIADQLALTSSQIDELFKKASILKA